MKNILLLSIIALTGCAFDSPEARRAAARIGQAAIDAAADETGKILIEQSERPSK